MRAIANLLFRLARIPGLRGLSSIGEKISATNYKVNSMKRTAKDSKQSAQRLTR